MATSYFQSPEFRRTAGNAADSGVKLLFRWLNWFILAAVNFVKEILFSIVGK